MHRGIKLVLVAVALAIAGLALWPRDFWQIDRLKKEALAEVRERARDDALRPTKGLPTTLHAAGRGDMRVVCGWVSSPTAPTPRFFFVLFTTRLAGVGVVDSFVQDSAHSASGSGIETWCRRPAIAQ